MVRSQRIYTLAVLALAAGRVLGAAVPATQPVTAATQPSKPAPGVLGFHMKDIDGKDVDLARYQGKVLLLVNVASRCGNTPQYKPLQALYEKYADKGLVILAFPANNFGGQEPGADEQIKTFCESKYGVTFPVFSKISVKGEDQHPLYRYLTSAQTNGRFAGDIKWNFEKFLVSRDGQVVQRFAPKTAPDSKEVIEAIEKQLAAAP